VIDKTAPDWPASIAATGFALTSYPVAVQNGWMTAPEAIERTLATLRFFWNSEQSAAPDATGCHGFYYPFLDMQTGRRAWQCEVHRRQRVPVRRHAGGRRVFQCRHARSTRNPRARRCIVSARGLAVAANRYRNDWPRLEAGKRLHSLSLGRVRRGAAALHARARIADPSIAARQLHSLGIHIRMEALLRRRLYCGPLSTHQLSHAWIDFRGIQDEFVRRKGIDYFENSRRSTLVQQRYAIHNPLGFNGYGQHSWGITASDGPSPDVRRIDGIERHFFDYEGCGAPFGIDDGTLAPWAVVASLPFAPDIVLPTIHHFVLTLQLHDQHRYGFKATFNQTFDGNPQSPAGWVSPWHYGLNLGPIVLMIENHLGGMIWNLMRGSPYVVDGLRRAGFAGGWL
jgi:hypothetical protein